MKRIRSRVTSAHVIAMLALFVAMGGTGYAALSLPKNSVGSKQIKKNAVTSTKVKNGSLKAGDFKAGQLPAGPAGPVGPAGRNGTNGADGTNGAPGEAVAYARVNSAGTLIGGPAQNKGIEQAMIQHTAGTSAAEVAGDGVYCFGGLGFDPTSAVVVTDNTDAMPAVTSATGGSLNFIPSAAVFKGEDLGFCDAAHGQARVAMEQVNNTSSPALVNHGFMIWFEK
jgi:hypothetical protein